MSLPVTPEPIAMQGSIAARRICARLMWVTIASATAFMFWMISYPGLFNRLYVFDDLGNSFFPFRYLYAEGLRAGRIDLWTPALFGGYYLHGAGEMGVLHPLHLLLYRFIPVVRAFSLEFLILYGALFAGSFLLFHHWVQDRLAAVFGAFVFAVTGKNLLYIVHPNRAGVIAHLPWLLLAIDRSFRGDRRYRNWWCLAIALLNGSELLFGYPYYFLVSAAFQAWYCLYLAVEIKHDRIRSIVRVAAGTALGTLLGAVQLIPTWESLKLSARSRPTLQFLAAGTLHPMNFLQWLNPYLYSGRRFERLPAHEFSIYAGIGPFLLCVWLFFGGSRTNRRLTVFLMGLAVLGIFLSLGPHNGLFRFYIRLPIMNLFRIPARHMLFVSFALAGGSSIALARLRAAPAARTPRWFFECLGWILVASVLTVPLKKIFGLAGSGYWASFNSAGAIAGGSLTVCAGCVLFGWALHSRRLGLAAFWVFAILDMTFYSATYLAGQHTGTIEYWLSEAPPVPPPGPVLVNGTDDRLVVGGYRLADGYSGLVPGTVLPLNDPKYLEAIGATALRGRNGVWSRVSDPLPPVRIARPVVSKNPAEAMSRIDLATEAVTTQDVSVDPEARGSVSIVSQHPGFIQIAAHTTGRALCVIAQRFHPGWTARIGDRRLALLPVDGDLTGFVVPKGNQEITLEFQPGDFILGRRISLMALAGVAILALCLALPRLKVPGIHCC